MPAIPCSASSFPPKSSIPPKFRLDVSWNELVWAAVTMGKPGIEFLFGHGWHSISDWIVRIHQVYAHLRESYGWLEKSSLYEELDPTEKGAISYFMGLLAAKVVGARLLDVPWLFHLSMIRSINRTAMLQGNSQPDLIGRRGDRRWVVVEAKGRSNGYSDTAMNAAKLQTQQLVRVNGQRPVLRVAVQAHFSSMLSWALHDPEDADPNGRDLEFDIGGRAENVLLRPPGCDPGRV